MCRLIHRFQLNLDTAIEDGSSLHLYVCVSPTVYSRIQYTDKVINRQQYRKEAELSRKQGATRFLAYSPNPYRVSAANECSCRCYFKNFQPNEMLSSCIEIKWNRMSEEMLIFPFKADTTRFIFVVLRSSALTLR